MTPVRDSQQQQVQGWWALTSKTMTIAFPVLLGACGTVTGYTYSKLQEHDKDIAVMKSSYQTKDDSVKSFEQLKDLIHSIDIKLSRIVPEGK